MSEPPLFFSEGLFTFGGLHWSLARVRKAHDCLRCRRAIPAGSEAFRPLTNGRYRMKRICTRCSPNKPEERK